MINNIDNLKKNRNNSVKLDKIKPISYVVLVVFTLFLLFNCIFSFNSSMDVNAGSTYTPATPVGNTSGYVNMDYEYMIKPVTAGSCWMFDWGDGTYSSWIEVGESDTLVSQFHSWGSQGVYEVRVKHRDVYDAESLWSLPLVVTVISDLDGDGWIDEVEFSYGTNATDPSDYPLDTDGDTIPDEDSSDGRYIGDFDDDNDELYDVIELQLGSDPKDMLDVKGVLINNIKHYLVDIGVDGISDIFYNTTSGVNTTIGITEAGMYLIDSDDDGEWDYIYDPLYGIVASYEEQLSSEFPWLLVIIGVIIAVVVIIFILFKTGILYFYEEYVVEE